MSQVDKRVGPGMYGEAAPSEKTLEWQIRVFKHSLLAGSCVTRQAKMGRTTQVISEKMSVRWPQCLLVITEPANNYY